jgi:hypothetical protein
MSASMHQDIMAVDERKPPAVGDFDPIPLDEIKLPPSSIPKKFAAASTAPGNIHSYKKPPMQTYNSASSSSGMSSSGGSGRISKDLFECLGKITDHGDENPYEPIPMSPTAQPRRVQRRHHNPTDSSRQSNQPPDQINDDPLEFEAEL